jgi:hypothetical protein
MALLGHVSQRFTHVRRAHRTRTLLAGTCLVAVALGSAACASGGSGATTGGGGGPNLITADEIAKSNEE